MILLLTLITSALSFNLTSIPSESGYIPIDDNSNIDNIFYWYFPHKNSTDLVIWLSGGPGCSSEVAVLFENGPFRLEN